MDFSFLKQLTETPGISGREEQVRALISAQLSQLSAQISENAMGNLIGHFPGAGPRVALIAHMDEIGFMVSKIDSEGFVRVVPIGGVDQRVFWAQKVIVHGRQDLPGVVGSVPPHLLKSGGQDADKAIAIEECFIDLGLPHQAIVENVAIGDPVTFATLSWENESSFFAKALDDRVGLFIMLEAVRRAQKIDCDLFLIASVQEEYGLRGVGPAVYAVKPDIAIALEGTVASDTPGLKLPANLTATVQGKGPEIRLTDQRMISCRSLVDFLDRLGREAGIERQLIVKKTGSTDAAMGQITGAGVSACAVAVPARYIHAPISMVAKSDVHQSIRLVTAFLENAATFKRST